MFRLVSELSERQFVPSASSLSVMMDGRLGAGLAFLGMPYCTLVGHVFVVAFSIGHARSAMIMAFALRIAAGCLLGVSGVGL